MVDQLLRKMQNENLKQKQTNTQHSNATGETHYHHYSVWCIINKLDKDNPENFSKYLKENKIIISFFQKKYLMEKYFNYSFEFNYDTQKWLIKKL